MTVWQRTERALAEHPMLGQLAFESIDLGNYEARVARLVPAERAYDVWRAARELGRDLGVLALLTADNAVHPDLGPLESCPAISLSEARERRERLVRASPTAADALDALRTATPQPEPYEERDFFLEDPIYESITLVILHCTLTEAALQFACFGEDPYPQQDELVAFVEHFITTYGAEPLYASSHVLEFEVARPPSDVAELRELARDFFLLSWARAEGYGVEEPGRLLRRLMSHRWIVWWYGL
jgi:hypothetical protein